MINLGFERPEPLATTILLKFLDGIRAQIIMGMNEERITLAKKAVGDALNNKVIQGNIEVKRVFEEVKGMLDTGDIQGIMSRIEELKREGNNIVG
jgi:hypothetical protein